MAKLTPEEEKKKRELFEGMSPKAQQRILKGKLAANPKKKLPRGMSIIPPRGDEPGMPRLERQPTAAGGSAGIDMMLYLLARLKSESAARLTQTSSLS